jgi:hypothetical protein
MYSEAKPKFEQIEDSDDCNLSDEEIAEGATDI